MFTIVMTLHDVLLLIKLYRGGGEKGEITNSWIILEGEKVNPGFRKALVSFKKLFLLFDISMR